MKTIEKEIGEVFEKLLKKHNVTFIFSYSYTNKPSVEPEEIKGRIGIYGSKEIIDISIEEIQKRIEKETKDDFVNV